MDDCYNTRTVPVTSWNRHRPVSDCPSLAIGHINTLTANSPQHKVWGPSEMAVRAQSGPYVLVHHIQPQDDACQTAAETATAVFAIEPTACRTRRGIIRFARLPPYLLSRSGVVSLFIALQMDVRLHAVYEKQVVHLVVERGFYIHAGPSPMSAVWILGIMSAYPNMGSMSKVGAPRSFQRRRVNPGSAARIRIFGQCMLHARKQEGPSGGLRVVVGSDPSS